MMRAFLFALACAALAACATSSNSHADPDVCAAMDAFHDSDDAPAISMNDVPATSSVSTPERLQCPRRSYQMTRNIQTRTVADVSAVLGFDTQKTRATLTEYNIGASGWMRGARPSRLCVAAREAQGWRVVGCVANLN